MWGSGCDQIRLNPLSLKCFSCHQPTFLGRIEPQPLLVQLPPKKKDTLLAGVFWLQQEFPIMPLSHGYWGGGVVSSGSTLPAGIGSEPVRMCPAHEQGK